MANLKFDRNISKRFTVKFICLSISKTSVTEFDAKMYITHRVEKLRTVGLYVSLIRSVPYTN